MGYHYTPARTSKIKTIVITPNTGEDAKNLDPSCTAGKNVKWYSHSFTFFEN